MPVLIVLLASIFMLAAAAPPFTPYHPRTLHIEPYWRNNSWLGIRYARLRKIRYLDQDVEPDKDGVIWGYHGWPDPLYGWVWTGKKTKLGREIRVRASALPDYRGKAIEELHTHQVQRLRRTKYGLGAGQRYRQAWVHVEWGVRIGARTCLEAKGGAGLREGKNWARLYDQLERAGIDPCEWLTVMTLSSIPHWRDRLRAVDEGAKIAGLRKKITKAVLPRGKRPDDFAHLWAIKRFDAVWGSQWGKIA